ncbi:hypothetical protein [Micromonospora sp. CNB394]|uniref:hypothetical protein n=1 Tax=Micromonospora sp. CNB394 TaxID=1169151 RepID=UPI0003A0B7D7|nr:hypothetical protein [Micromonospora sp. CNB394]
MTLCVVTAAYNLVFFVVLGYPPLFLRLDVIPLGLAFTGWALGLAAGILLIGHRLTHRIGAVQTLGVALLGLLICMVRFATSTGAAMSLGSADRRAAAGAFLPRVRSPHGGRLPRTGHLELGRSPGRARTGGAGGGGVHPVPARARWCQVNARHSR